MSSKDKEKTADNAVQSPVLTELFEHWSSHPTSLKRQRKWWFGIGLIPVAAVLLFGIQLLSGASGWRAIVGHPTTAFWILGGAVSLSLGMVFAFALLYLVARSRISTQTEDPDRMPFPRALVILFAFFWVVPAALSLIQAQWGVQIVPQQALFVLNALCFAPFVLLLVWIGFATGDDNDGSRTRKRRRPIWFILGLLFLGLAGLSLVADLQGLVRNLQISAYLAGLSTPTLRIASLAALLPLSMVCFAIWSLFKRILDEEEAKDGNNGEEGELKSSRKKSIWMRILDFLRGVLSEPASDEPEPNDDTPPAWLARLCGDLPDGVRIATEAPPKPDRLPKPGSPATPVSRSADADPFWMLMGGEEKRRPTELQVLFFKRFRDSVEEVRQAAAKGNDVSPDIILSGDEGTGRTEAMLAAALYAAFARRQRVLYLVSDPKQAETLRDKADRRFKDIFLDCFLRSGILEPNKTRRWVDEIKARPADGQKPAPTTAEPVDPDAVPPNILFATPRDVERLFFEGRGIDADGSAIAPLRELLRLFEVVMIDDFMEFDVTERAHLPFLIHKLRMILVSGNRRPQFVVSTPRLREGDGVKTVADKLFGSGFNLASGDNGNAITLLPRECEPAWSLPLVLRDDRNPDAICRSLVELCLGLTGDSGESLKVVLYRKGLHPHQCDELKADILSAAAKDGCAAKNENLLVISHLDEVVHGGCADAVFYMTALAGRAGMALRLSVGDGKTVYISLSTESEAVLGDDGGPQILPAIPDSTAVALRVHHLRSLLRFVTPGQPVDVSPWERFGIFISPRIRVVDVDAGGVIHEKWRQDDWDEPAYGNPPLWPYIAFESEGSVKSNAGKGTDFGVLPYTDEDIARLGDAPLIALVKPKSRQDGKEIDAGIGAGSLAKWIDDQGIERGVLDLSHAQALVMGRSALGDAYASASGAAQSVFTAGPFEDPDEDDKSCVCKMPMITWNGNGLDYDTPVRSLAWTIEPASVPKAPVSDPGEAFTFFNLPDCRDLPRTINAVISGLANRLGQEREETKPYSYPSYFSGVLLAPRHMGRNDKISLMQRSVAGKWETDDELFSTVLTHIFTGILGRIIPDLPYYATVAVFHQRGRDEAVAAAVAWFLQPLNSGRTVEALIRDTLLKPDGQAAVQKALREARALFEARTDPKSRLRWLRSFSGSAFALDLKEPAKAEAFEKDVAWSLEVLDIIDKRISGNAAEIEEFQGPILEILRDHSWMSEPKTFDPAGFLPDSAWDKRTEFPAPPALDRNNVPLVWHYAGKDFALSAGFAEKDGQERYCGFLDNSFRERICGDSYTEYGFNDPYRDFIGNLCDKLRKLAEEALPGATPTQLAEFLLAFVQEALPYVRDPKNKRSDWPRHPSETLLRIGGDCEDSSILYAELLRRFRIESAILSVPEHAAVGVNVPMSLTADRKPPISYSWLGKDYIYAETACDKFSRPLGSETAIIRSADEVPGEIIPTPDLKEDDATSVRIINAVGPNSGSLEVTLVAPEGTSSPLAVAVFARPRKFVFDEPDAKSYPCVGGAMLPILAPRKVVSATLKLDTPQDFRSYWYDVFVCEPSGIVRGHFVGVAHFSR